VGEGLLPVWPVTRSVTRLLTSDVSVVPLRLRRNAELRFVGRIATDRDIWDAVAGSKPSDRTWDLAVGSLSATFHLSARLERTAASPCLRRLRSGRVAARRWAHRTSTHTHRGGLTHPSRTLGSRDKRSARSLQWFVVARRRSRRWSGTGRSALRLHLLPLPCTGTCSASTCSSS
jgi:hypothetical protein